MNTICCKSENFIKIEAQKFEDKNFQKLIRFYQEKEIFAKSQNQNLRDQFYFERLRYFHDKIRNYDLFLNKLSALEKETNFIFLKQNIRIVLAKYYSNEGYNTKNKDYITKTLELIELVLSQKENQNALSEAEYLKNNILGKSLEISVNKEMYENQNHRAFVNFKNIDTLKISYFKLPSKNYKWFENYSKNTKDSLINEFISKNKALKTYFRTLPKGKEFFKTSTEILLEKMEVGSYLLVVENTKTFDNREKIKFYQHISITNMIYHTDHNDKEDVFFIYDRKTGKPLENVIVRNDEKTTLSNKNGKAIFLKREYNKHENNFSKLYFIKDNDTLVDEYHKGELNTKEDYVEEDRFEAKANVYFDRAIYRPGQKVFYKGIIIQNKDKKKSVVPFLSVNVRIEDVNGKTIKEYDVQTNEFGSFSGEFEIPKNVLTGEFSLYINEPEDYEKDKKYYDEKEDEHSFWDNVNFNEYESYIFKVEEYKRPTFEITFDDIKEKYTIGDTLKIKGNAKALAGSNLTGVKVKYSISKSILDVEDDYSEDDFEKETTTNSEGNFELELIANDEILKNNQIKNIRFKIDVEITDLNGETRVAKKEVYVNQKTILLNAIVNNEYIKEENNKLTIKSTNYNSFPVDSKGEIKIYQIKEKAFLIERNLFPEIQNITKEEFKNLFPHEPYEISDLENETILTKTLYFDTQKSKEINLNFLFSFDADFLFFLLVCTKTIFYKKHQNYFLFHTNDLLLLHKVQ